MEITAPKPLPDLDLRLVRYFVAVAEHENFGRAAEALHLAQPSLSRQIQRLEQQLGARLFDRTPRGSVLTEAGEAFLPQARVLLQAARRATLSARAAAVSRTFTIGYVGDLTVTPVTRELRRRHPEVQVRTRHLDDADVSSALLEHKVDALIARLPFPADGLDVQVLYEEPRVLLVPATHPLAGRETVALDDFAGDVRVSCKATDAGWRAFWRLEPDDDGVPAPVTPVTIDSFEDKLELVAAGEAVAILPAGDRRLTLRPDLVTVPIRGVDPGQVVAATRTDDHDPVTTTFLTCAENALARRPVPA